MKLDDIPFQRDGEYLCATSSIENLPLLPHKSSPLVTSLVGIEHVSLCFRKSKKNIVYFTPCVKVKDKIYRIATDEDSEMCLVLSRKYIKEPNNASLLEKEYVKLLRPCFLLSELGCFSLCTTASDKVHTISKEIYQTMKRS